MYLDVKLQVLVHGVDAVKDVAGNARDDPHQLGVVQLALNTAADTLQCFTVKLHEWSYTSVAAGLKVELKLGVKSSDSQSRSQIKKGL